MQEKQAFGSTLDEGLKKARHTRFNETLGASLQLRTKERFHQSIDFGTSSGEFSKGTKLQRKYETIFKDENTELLRRFDNSSGSYESLSKERITLPSII